MKRGQYICPKCSIKFAWGFGFTEKAPEIHDNDRIKAVCPECNGLKFKSPIEVLIGPLH